MDITYVTIVISLSIDMDALYVRGLFKKFSYERLFIRKNNVCLTDFVHKYSSFHHTCTCDISMESIKYQ